MNPGCTSDLECVVLHSARRSGNHIMRLDELRGILKMLKHATSFFSRATPNLPTVIPVMDVMDEALATESTDHALGLPIRAAVRIGKLTLDQYYALINASDIYRIAMVLHPRHKLLYFKNATWEDEWVQTAERLVRDKFEQHYKTMSASNHGVDSESDSGEVMVSPVEKSVKVSKNMFDHIPALAPPKQTNPS